MDRADRRTRVAETADVMVVSPHPDDAEFGVAGTVARWVKEGKRVIYVVCTNGDKGTSDINMKSEKLAEIRKKEQQAAADILGVSEVIFLGLPDQGLEETPEFRGLLVRLIRQYRPDTIVTADPYRHYIWHRDHRITGQVTWMRSSHTQEIISHTRIFLKKAYNPIKSGKCGSGRRKKLTIDPTSRTPSTLNFRPCAATTARCRRWMSPILEVG